VVDGETASALPKKSAKMVLPKMQAGRQSRQLSSPSPHRPQRRSIEIANLTDASTELAEPAIDKAIKLAVTLLASGVSTLKPAPKVAVPQTGGGTWASDARKEMMLVVEGKLQEAREPVASSPCHYRFPSSPPACRVATAAHRRHFQAPPALATFRILGRMFFASAPQNRARTAKRYRKRSACRGELWRGSKSATSHYPPVSFATNCRPGSHAPLAQH
jgi:hypothetical protein